MAEQRHEAGGCGSCSEPGLQSKPACKPPPNTPSVSSIGIAVKAAYPLRPIDAENEVFCTLADFVVRRATGGDDPQSHSR